MATIGLDKLYYAKITEADSMRYLPDILADNRVPEKM